MSTELTVRTYLDVPTTETYLGRRRLSTNVDDDPVQTALQYLGSFGPYQAYVYLLLFLPGFVGGVHSLVFSWTAYVPRHRCALYANDSAVTHGLGYVDEWKSVYLRYPVDRNESMTSCVVCDNELPEAQCTSSAAHSCQVGHVYDGHDPVFADSLAVQFDMACDNLWMKQLLWSLFTTGVLLGAAIFSPISDTWGRKKAFLLSALGFFASTLAQAFAVNFIAFAILQLLTGIFESGCYLTAYVVFIELVDGWPRTVCGIWYQGMFTCGMLYVALCAYITRHWQHVQLLAAAPIALLALYYWLLPESVRWLATRGRGTEACELLDKAARCNRCTIPMHAKEHIIADCAMRTKQERKANGSLLDLFRHPSLAKSTLIVFYSWFATSMGFYGLSQNTADLPGSPFLTYTLSGLAEFPAYAISPFLMEYWGRKPSLVLMFTIQGLSCIAAAFIQNSVLVVVAAMLGKLSVSASFAILYNYSAELFPTVVRQTGTGYSSVCARVGALLAPQIRLLGNYVVGWLPIVIYGLVGLLAALLDLMLPETKGRDLPETIADGIAFTKQDKWLCKTCRQNIED